MNKTTHNFPRMRAAGVLIVAVALFASSSSGPFIPHKAEAAVSGWQQGANILPKHTTDFGSDSFRQSLRELADTGASHVALVIPYYQANIWSTDIYDGYNTPTDESLRSAIQYAKSLGLQVVLKIHLESQDGKWRANINPDNRAAWFESYGNKLKHLAGIAQSEGASALSVGTELVSMAIYNPNDQKTSQNEYYWRNLIGQVKGIYGGQVTYGANSTNGNNHDYFSNEKSYISFWDQLDYASLSAYYKLAEYGQTSTEAMKQGWNRWHYEDLMPFAARVNKPIVFAEIGYRSVQDAQVDPWNWEKGGWSDTQVQANAYEALFGYWNDQNYLQGSYIWEWESDPNAGGNGSTSYTPQNKPAEEVLKKWYGAGAPNPNPNPNPNPGQVPGANSFDTWAFTTTGTPSANAPVGITVGVKNTNAHAVSGILVDIEIYNETSNRVEQRFVSGQSFGSGEHKDFPITWTPSSNGTYTVKAGIFNDSWSANYSWNDNALRFTVGTQQNPDPEPDPEPDPGTGGTSTPPTAGNIQIWWPTDGVSVSGLQPLKAMVENLAVENYRMYWKVDDGSEVPMDSNYDDYPHKEALVDFTGWNWKGEGPYRITFVVRGNDGSFIKDASIDLYVR